MILPILQDPDPVLYTVSEPVIDFDNKISVLITDMIETCKMTDNCVGLAAIQVNMPLRISVIKLGKKYIHIINPEIVYASGIMSAEWEGCMSAGEKDDQLFSKVRRDTKITVKYQDKQGRYMTRQCNGFVAHAFQHEIDHMNGILFLSHVQDKKNLWKDKDLNTYLEKHNKLPL